MPCRGRLATCLLYLNSAVAEHDDNDDDDMFEGGSTTFPEFDISVIPARGSAVFWWNTVERPGSLGYDAETTRLTVDERLRHSGDPVTSEEKWICNRWIHPIPFGGGVRGL